MAMRNETGCSSDEGIRYESRVLTKRGTAPEVVDRADLGTGLVGVPRGELSGSVSSGDSCCISSAVDCLTCEASSPSVVEQDGCSPSVFDLPSPPAARDAVEYVQGLHMALEHCILRRLTLEQSVDCLCEVGWHPRLCRRVWAELAAQNRSFFAEYERQCLVQC